GRGTLQITFSGQNATFDEVFYVASPSLGVIQDVSQDIIGDGSLLGQAGSIASSGNFAVNLTGQISPSGGNVGFEEDFVSQVAVGSGGAITGSTDFVELGSTSRQGQPFVNITTTGTLKINGDGTGRNGVQFLISPSSHRNFTGYVG